MKAAEGGAGPEHRVGRAVARLLAAQHEGEDEPAATSSSRNGRTPGPGVDDRLLRARPVVAGERRGHGWVRGGGEGRGAGAGELEGGCAG